MISTRKGIPVLRVVPTLPAAPSFDLDELEVDARGAHFGAIQDAELVWYLGSSVPVGVRATTVPLEPGRARHVFHLAGKGGWVEVTVEGEQRRARPAPPSVDGSGIGFSESAFYCREACVIGYDQALLTVSHPVGGAVRRIDLDVDVVHGCFDTSAYLGLSAGDRVKLELGGPGGGYARDFVFPKPADPWTTWSLDQLTQTGTGIFCPKS